MRTFRNAVAVITGAGSGIGRALAVQLAAEGALLAISDVDLDGLAETARRCRSAGATDVHERRLDVADRDDFTRYGDEVLARFGRVNLVVNNAGVALSSLAVDHDWDDVDWLLGINLGGVINGTQVFLPHLVRDSGHLVNISSLFGLMAMPTQSIYNAAKFGVRGYTESIRQEMDAHGHPVHVHCVHPGGIATNIARSARTTDPATADAMAERFDRMLARTSPEEAARTILDGARRGRSRIVVGPDAKALYLLTQLTGTLLQKVVPALYRRFFSQQALADVVPAPERAGTAA